MRQHDPRNSRPVFQGCSSERGASALATPSGGVPVRTRSALPAVDAARDATSRQGYHLLGVPDPHDAAILRADRPRLPLQHLAPSPVTAIATELRAVR